MASRAYTRAAEAFEEAIAARPEFTAAKSPRARSADAGHHFRHTTESHNMLTATTLDLPTAPDVMPPAPNTLEEAGLSLDLLTQLALKHLHFSGELKGSDLAARLGVNFSVVEPALEFLKASTRWRSPAAPSPARRRTVTASPTPDGRAWPSSSRPTSTSAWRRSHTSSTAGT